MGQNLALCAQLGAARSRQDESIEVHEVGSKRPFSGCNGVHFAWCGGLICALVVVLRCKLPLLLHYAMALLSSPVSFSLFPFPLSFFSFLCCF
jgi:hypothetical protein